MRGTPQTVAKLTVADLKAFHAQHYGPHGMIVVIVGAVKAADAVEIVRARFDDWPNPHQPAEPALPAVPPITAKAARGRRAARQNPVRHRAAACRDRRASARIIKRRASSTACSVSSA